MVMAALTALKSTNDDFGIVILLWVLVVKNCAAHEVEPHPNEILSSAEKISRWANMPILACPMLD